MAFRALDTFDAESLYPKTQTSVPALKSCPVNSVLCQWIAGELSANETELWAKHIEQCEGCQRILDELPTMDGSLGRSGVRRRRSLDKRMFSGLWPGIVR